MTSKFFLTNHASYQIHTNPVGIKSQKAHFSSSPFDRSAMASHPPSEVVFASPAAKADESFTTAPTDLAAMPSSPSSTAPVDTKKLRASLLKAEIAPTAITDASTLDGSSFGNLSILNNIGQPFFLPTTALKLRRHGNSSDSDSDDESVLNDEEMNNAKERQSHKIEANSAAAAARSKMIYDHLMAHKKQSAEQHEETILGQEDIKIGQEQAKEEILETVTLQHEESTDMLRQLLRLAEENGDGAKVKMLQHRIKALQAEARAREKQNQDHISALQQALDKERSQNARGRSGGLAVASSNVRPSAPSAPAGKRPVVAEMVHCGRRTTTAQVEADKTRSRKSTFFSTKR